MTTSGASEIAERYSDLRGVDRDLTASEAAQTRQEALGLLAEIADGPALSGETRDLAHAALRACGHVTLGSAGEIRRLALTIPDGHMPYVERHHTADDIARAGICAALTGGWYHAVTLLAILRDKVERLRRAQAEIQIRSGRAYPHLVRAAQGDADKLEESIQRGARALAATLAQRETEHAARHQQ